MRKSTCVSLRNACGRCEVPNCVVVAALSQLDQQEQLGEFDSQEMEHLLTDGEAGGLSLEGQEVLSELRELRERSKSKAG